MVAVRGTAGIGQHFLWQSGFKGSVDFRHLFAKHFGKGLSQRLTLGNVQQYLSSVIQADDTFIVVNHDNRVLHILKHSLVRDRTEVDDLFTEKQPGIDRQHPCENERQYRNRVGPDAGIVKDSGDGRGYCRTDDEKQSATVRRGDR